MIVKSDLVKDDVLLFVKHKLIVCYRFVKNAEYRVSNSKLSNQKNHLLVFFQILSEMYTLLRYCFKIDLLSFNEFKKQLGNSNV